MEAKMKIANMMFILLGVIVLICGILNIWNPLFGDSSSAVFAITYGATPFVPIVGLSLLAIGLAMVVKGTEDEYGRRI
jgi:hypothetical protein